MNRPIRAVGKTLITLCILLSAIENAVGSDFIPYKDLAGTIWLSEETHTRSSVDSNGGVEYKEGKDVYIKFLDLRDGVYSIKVHWWNEERGINVVEYGVLIRHAENIYTYIESDHPAASDFPGIAGAGTFRLLDASTAEITQLGRLLDGSASAFVNRLHRVSKIPAISIPQSYPRIK